MNLNEDLNISPELKNLLTRSLEKSQKIQLKEQKEFNSKKEVHLFLKEKKLIKDLLKDKQKDKTKYVYLLNLIYDNFYSKLTRKDIHNILIYFGYFPRYFYQALIYFLLFFICLLLNYICFQGFKIYNKETGILDFIFFLGMPVFLMLKIFIFACFWEDLLVNRKL